MERSRATSASLSSEFFSDAASIPAALCIGGMEGVENEVKLFHEHHEELPVYALESTGGATKRLAIRAEYDRWVRVPERKVRETVEEFWRKRGEPEGKQAEEKHFAFPYAYIAQKIVRELINPAKHDSAQ